jgi:hypothetical protein
MAIITFSYQKTPKSIGGFEIDAFVAEQITHSNTVTDIPMEDGSIANDHVQENADDLQIQAFIGKAKFETWEGKIPEMVDELPQEDPKARIKQAYFELLRITKEKQPVDVVMGLTTATNMIITSFQIGRDAASGANLPFTMVFKKVRIVKSETTTITANSGAASGDQTAGTADMGTAGSNKPNPQSNRMKEEWRQSVQAGMATPEEYQEKWGVPYPQ